MHPSKINNTHSSSSIFSSFNQNLTLSNYIFPQTLLFSELSFKNFYHLSFTKSLTLQGLSNTACDHLLSSNERNPRSDRQQMRPNSGIQREHDFVWWCNSELNLVARANHSKIFCNLLNKKPIFLHLDRCVLNHRFGIKCPFIFSLHNSNDLLKASKISNLHTPWLNLNMDVVQMKA